MTDHACPSNEDAVALALHVLEPDEEIAVRTHLPHCRSCRETVRSTELVMRSLGTSVPQIDPPARLRSNVLAQVAETPQDVPRREPAPRPVARSAARRSARPDVARHRRRAVAISLAAAAVLGFAGITTYAVQVQHQRDAQIAQTRALADLLTRAGMPGAVRATLATDAGRAMGVVLAAPAGPVVVTAGMPPNHRDTSTYVLWGIDSAGPHPLGTFDVVPDTTVYPFTTTDAAFAAYAVSLEPGRVMPAAPTAVVASGPVLA